ncbi:MAG: ATP-binding protein [Eubacterium sp.]|nr:ATP-binding protein [Eubacterium sp.]
MYKELSNLIMYRELGQDSILVNLGNIIKDMEGGQYDKDQIISRIYGEIRRLLELGTNYGFDKNLWHDYIAYILITSENPFSLTAERVGRSQGSVNNIVLRDMEIFSHIFNYDFSHVEEELGIDSFSTLTNYRSVHKRRQIYNKNASQKIRALSDEIDNALKDDPGDSAERMLDIVSDFYAKHGVGMFGLNSAFRIVEEDRSYNRDSRGSQSLIGNVVMSTTSASWNTYQGGEVQFFPINNIERVTLDKLVGYEIQKQKIRENTESFLDGKAANNVLLFGDAGTGKSTSIKALINEYEDRGLRMIEIYKHQMGSLSSVISSVKSRNYRFIIYMDDLSFEENETEYKYLKAVIEGGLENRPDNVLIYATSNRRNLIRETWNDTKDVDLDKHRSDTLQEKLSLVSRFGVSIPFMRPNKKEYEEIVRVLAGRLGDLGISEEELLNEAGKWSVSHGGMSGRAAQQLIDRLS